MLNFFPTYFTNKAIGLYIAAVILVMLLFSAHTMAWYFYVFGLLAVAVFFHYSGVLTGQWQVFSEKQYAKKLFTTALVIRLIWVVFAYFFYSKMTGMPFEWHPADVLAYHASAADLARRGFKFHADAMYGFGPSDMGYPTYLGVVYMFTDSRIIIARILKALMSAYMCVMIYRLATRNFGEETGRIAGVLAMLMPHFIYYSGSHMKETEMLFLMIAFVERADYLLRTRHFNFINIAVPIALAVCLFFFRTVLGMTALMAFLSAIVFSSAKIVSWGQRIMVSVWILAVVAYFLGGKISEEVNQVWEGRHVAQDASMEWRSNRAGGNEFARYAGTAVFAPMIFTIPFPTMVNVGHQQNQQMVNGMNFVKNITAFFTAMGIFLLFYRRQWREHTLLLAFIGGYLAVIAMSQFAHSERFHMPSLPFAVIFAAYGISQMDNQKKKYFTLYAATVFVAIIVWSWFKLAGRGMI